MDAPTSGFGFHCAVLSSLMTVCINAMLKDLMLPLKEHFGQETKSGKITAYLINDQQAVGSLL